MVVFPFYQYVWSSFSGCSSSRLCLKKHEDADETVPGLIDFIGTGLGVEHCPPHGPSTEEAQTTSIPAQLGGELEILS